MGVFCAECLLHVRVIPQLTQQLKDYLVILVEETFIRLIYHVDEMIEIVKLLLPTANAGSTWRCQFATFSL